MKWKKMAKVKEREGETNGFVIEKREEKTSGTNNNNNFYSAYYRLLHKHL